MAHQHVTTQTASQYNDGMEPILHNGEETLSFRQIDQLNDLTKGTAFRLFKGAGDQLREGVDFYYLPAQEHTERIHQLKACGKIYATTTHLVLLTRSGYAKLQQLSTMAPRRNSEGG